MLDVGFLADRFITVNHALELPVFVFMAPDRVWIKSVSGMNGTLGIRQRDDPIAALAGQSGEVITGIAETLDRHTEFFRGFAAALGPQIKHLQRATSGGRGASPGTAQP